MKIFGHPWSPNTRKVLLTIAEKGHAPDLVVVDIPKGEHKSPEYLAKKNPLGLVPVLVDGDFVLFESRAITAYVDQVLPGPRLTPADPKGAALVEQWISVADTGFAPTGEPLIVETLLRKHLGGAPNQALIDQGRAGIARALDALDGALRDRPFVAGDAFTRADIHWMPFVECLVRGGEGAAITRRERLAAWWGRVSERPTWQAIARTGPQP